MPRKRCATTDHRRVAVKFVDQATGKSLSLTVYGADLANVARRAQAELGIYWTTTKLTDRRHKRR